MIQIVLLNLKDQVYGNGYLEMNKNKNLQWKLKNSDLIFNWNKQM